MVIPVWIDTDPAVGEAGADVDDGYAILQALRSPELQIIGISTVFGNTTRPRADRVARSLLELAGASHVQLYSGANNARELGQLTAASRELCAALERQALTVIALGPLTNVATALIERPELAGQIAKVVFVGGRRPGQQFTVNGRGPFPDFNFECDPAACEVLLASRVPLVLAGFEVSTYATLTPVHLDRLAKGPPAARWLARHSRPWLARWAEEFRLDGFHPFDTLAIAAVARPEMVALSEAAVTIVGGDGTAVALVASVGRSGRPVDYAARAAPDFVDDLLGRLLAG
ncbi:MAG: nucleoside hydrolase [Acidobacteriota bacterium]|nr:nucleoside hydrolase [Acidobacteriota bacterium]